MVLGQIYRRSRTWLYLSMLVFIITGIYLMSALATRRFRLYVNSMAIAGGLVLLLTALSQIE